MLDELLNILLNEDELGAVIRSHIFIEQHIDHFLSIAVSNPDYLDKINIDFSNKIKLAVALGMNEEVYKPLNAITNIRNKFAHRADTQLDKSQINNFYKSFTPEDQNGIQEIITNNPDGPKSLAKKFSLLSIKEQFVVMVILLAIRVQHELTIELEYMLKQVDEDSDA